jgi:hypothetical protein
MGDMAQKPGPGNYETKTHVGEAAKYSMGLKTENGSAMGTGNLNPGPG